MLPFSLNVAIIRRRIQAKETSLKKDAEIDELKVKYLRFMLNKNLSDLQKQVVFYKVLGKGLDEYYSK